VPQDFKITEVVNSYSIPASNVEATLTPAEIQEATVTVAKGYQPKEAIRPLAELRLFSCIEFIVINSCNQVDSQSKSPSTISITTR